MNATCSTWLTFIWLKFQETEQQLLAHCNVLTNHWDDKKTLRIRFAIHRLAASE